VGREIMREEEGRIVWFGLGRKRGEGGSVWSGNERSRGGRWRWKAK
jgi:hypothetical protein